MEPVYDGNGYHLQHYESLENTRSGSRSGSGGQRGLFQATIPALPVPAAILSTIQLTISGVPAQDGPRDVARPSLEVTAEILRRPTMMIIATSASDGIATAT